MKKIFLILFITPLLLNAKERIIALSPAINEILFALDANDSIIGNTDYSLYPKISQKLPKVGGYFSPNLEKIVSLNPSLVIMQNNNHSLSLKLKQLRIKTQIVQIDTLKSIKETILQIGTTLHNQQKAKKIVDKIDKELTSLKNIIANKRILIVFGRNPKLDKNIFVAGQNLYYDEIINESNNTNALHSNRKGQPILNMEKIIACNPDIVLLLARHKDDGLTNKELIEPWLKLPISASKTKAIYINEKIYAGIPSNRVILFLRDFRAMLEDYRDKIKKL